MEAAREVGVVEGQEALVKVVLAQDEDNRESKLLQLDSIWPLETWPVPGSLKPNC